MMQVQSGDQSEPSSVPSQPLVQRSLSEKTKDGVVQGRVKKDARHPHLIGLFQRILQLQHTEVRKLLVPLAANAAFKLWLQTQAIADYTSAKPSKVRILLAKGYPEAVNSTLCQNAALIALLGVHDGLDAIRILGKGIGMAGPENFTEFIKSIRLREKQLLETTGRDSEAIVYGFTLLNGTFGECNASGVPFGLANSQDRFEGCPLTILQYKREDSVVYQIFDAERRGKGLRSNIFGRSEGGDDSTNLELYYSPNEFYKIMDSLSTIINASDWTKEHHRLWKELTGDDKPEWIGQKATTWYDGTQGFRYLHSTTRVNFDTQQLQSLEDARGPLNLYEYVEHEVKSWQLSVTSYTKTQWPVRLQRLAWLTGGSAGKVFDLLKKMMEQPKKEILARAVLYQLAKSGLSREKKYTVVANTGCVMTNCGALASALQTFFRPDVMTEPEKRISKNKFSKNIGPAIDKGESMLLESRNEGEAKLYSFNIIDRMMGSKPRQIYYGGHQFHILQYLNPKNEVRYVTLDAYEGQRQGPESLVRRSKRVPSVTREELESFLGNLCKISDATVWTAEHADRYYEAFGARHPALLGLPCSRSNGPLGIATEIYPVDMSEVVKRNDPKSGELPGAGVITKIEFLGREEYFKRRAKERPESTEGWWIQQDSRE